MKKNYSSNFLSVSLQFKLQKWNLFSAFIALSMFTSLFAQQTYTFTNCSVTGSVGPTQLQANTAYLSTNLNGSVTIVGSGIQTWTVPSTGLYRITALGASSGWNNNLSRLPGLAALMQGEFSLTSGDVLQILVGQMGQDNTFACAGGGGSFVTKTPHNTMGSILVIAGGGGGPSADFPGISATTASCGTFDAPNSSGPAQCGGSGGLSFSGNSGGGGGGFFTDGQSLGSVGGTIAHGGQAYINGGVGGSSNTQPVGGFGGGGGHDNGTGTTACASAGGGFSGGNGGNRTPNRAGGGGGGSFNTGANQLNSVATVTGHGKVVIESLCNINLVGNGLVNNVAICSGNSLTLTTSAVSNYTWSNGNTTSTMIVVSPTSSQTYSVIGTSTAACQASSSISVTVNSGLPVLTITNTPNNICLGKTATLTAGGAITYTWAGGPGGIINGQTFTPTATSNYTVTGQNGCGTITSITTITVAPLVVNTAASSTLVCSGSPATLTANSAVTSYTWYPVAIPGNSVIVAPTANTVYTVVASDGTCSGVATVSLNTKPNPTLSIAASNQTVCEGAIVTMTASGALTYTWTSPASNSPNISDNPTAPTLYQVSGTNSLNCVASTNQIIFTDPTPTIAITSNKTIVCSGDPVTLTASGATTYNWTNGPPTAGNVVNPTSNTTYTASGTTANCTGTQTITINVLTASVAVSVSTPSICNGASTDLHASGATSYIWIGLSSFNGNVTVTPSLTTVYNVNATTTASGLNCPSSNNITVTVFNNPTVTISATKTLVCKSDPNIVLTAGGAITYTWSTATVSTNISVHPQSTTTYSITGVDANGCMNTASQLIQVNTCNGIAEFNDKKNNISIYPNPSNGEFVVSSDSDINLKLINELGQEIKTMSLTDQNDHKLSITNLANGVYFIVGQNNTDKVSQKIIVAK